VPFDLLQLELIPLASAVPARFAECSPDRLRSLLATAHAQGARLVALWGVDDQLHEAAAGAELALHIALASATGMLWLRVPLSPAKPEYPDISDIFSCAARMQRAAFDLCGIRAAGADARPWLRHGAWPAGAHPLARDFDPERAFAGEPDAYSFVPVEGEGVHEIPVGPVHAGTIEPGHFRFSVVGEKVLRLEERLGYVHKGIEKRFESMTLVEGARLAGRVSGDSTVAYAWAYAMAVESATGTASPPRALWLRALALERERLTHHLGDLGALGNDGGLAFGLSQFMRLKEDVLRLHERLFGHRYLMDQVIPGGAARDADRAGLAALVEQGRLLAREVRVLKDIYDEHAGLQDRFLTCGRLTPDTAARLGVVGPAGRASNQPWDMRSAPGLEPYRALGLRPARHSNGDVAARVAVRFEEVFESLRLIAAIAERMPAGPIAAELRASASRARGLGWVEGWRGDVLVAIESGDGGRIRRCHAHDPSWQNWPALEHAVMGNIVPDFPLINKSFNLSYSGHDL
jgi:Ni,Fe-hydrogenase III large subunit/Ni,Fe-hydrogenase III component G